jgi:hypothetical protein
MEANLRWGSRSGRFFGPEALAAMVVAELTTPGA